MDMIFFYFNGVEIYRKCSRLEELNLTCEEFLIKNIIE